MILAKSTLEKFLSQLENQDKKILPTFQKLEGLELFFTILILTITNRLPAFYGVVTCESSHKIQFRKQFTTASIAIIDYKYL